MSKNRPENDNGINTKRNSDNDSKPDTLNLIELKKKDINSLIQIARDYDIENANSMRGQELLFALLQAQTKRKGIIYGAGVLEALPDGYGVKMKILVPRGRLLLMLNSIVTLNNQIQQLGQ